MFYYELYSWEDCITLYHFERYSHEDFTKLCEEVDVNLFDEQDLKQIEKHLVDNHGFKRVRAVADYFINNR
jgi:hypothetical protein